MKDFEKILAEGLAAGYAGNAIRRGVDRAGFKLEGSHVTIPEGVYHDEWMADRVGGGQELVRTKDGKVYTRVYGGGTISEEELAKLGITKKEVTNYLKAKLKELGDKTRLNENCMPEPDEDWRYSYGIISHEESIPLTFSRENIFYKDAFVFTHGFIICSVE